MLSRTSTVRRFEDEFEDAKRVEELIGAFGEVGEVAEVGEGKFGKAGEWERGIGEECTAI